MRRIVLIAVGVVLVALAVFAGYRLLVTVDPLQRVAGAPQATVEAGTARVAVSGTVEGVPLLSPLQLTVGEGEMDLVARRARLTREVPGLSGRSAFGVSVPPVELLYDGGTVYLRLPDEDERWGRVRDGAEEAAGGADETGPGLGHPLGALGLLQTLEGRPEELREEAVRGERTTRFRVVVDLDEAGARLDPPASDHAARVRRLRGRPDLPVDVWLDDDNRVRRLRYRFELDVPGMPDVTVDTDVELFDFGAPVAVDPPAPDEVVDLSPARLRELDPLRRLREALERLPG